MPNSMKAFVVQAMQFLDFVDSCTHLPLNEKLQKLSVLLAGLYMAASNLPDVEPTDRDFDLAVSKPQVSFEDVDGYWEVFDPYEQNELLMASLTDDISDIYSHLKTGFSIYERGTEADIADAIWNWKFDFESHWGFHLVDALRAIHWAIQRR